MCLHAETETFFRVLQALAQLAKPTPKNPNPVSKLWVMVVLETSTEPQGANTKSRFKPVLMLNNILIHEVLRNLQTWEPVAV